MTSRGKKGMIRAGGFGRSYLESRPSAGLVSKFNLTETFAREQRMADVLVVDDDRDTLKLVAMILNRAGHRVMPVERGSEALAHVAKNRPDVVLLDIMLPDLDGFSVAQKMRTQMQDPPPILFFSARGSPEDQITSRTLGNGFLMKPVRLTTLLAAVRSVLEANPKKEEPS
jgi:two-component system OmpR family response regulator